MDEVNCRLEDGAEVHKKNNAGFTALDMAILHRHLDIAKRLCQEMGVGTSVLDDNAPSPYWAANRGRVNVVMEVLNRGAYINVQTNGGGTPLYWASYKGHIDFVKFLVNNKAGVNAKDHHGKRTLHYAEHCHYTAMASYIQSQGGIKQRSCTKRKCGR